MINYSIIIPHRNTPQLLNRLIDSIPDRDDIEIFIVDNSDTPLKVTYNKTINVNILYSDNKKGAGHARNEGLKKITGKWVVFADADDYFSNNAFEYFDHYSNSSASIVYFGVISKFSETGLDANRGDFYMRLVRKYIEEYSTEKEELLRFKHVVPWGKMFKKDLIDNNTLAFDEVIASNDIMFSARAAKHAEIIEADMREVYCVTVSKGSLTQSTNKDVNLSRYLVALRYNQFLKDCGQSKYQISVLVYLKNAMSYGTAEFLKYCRLAAAYRSNVLFLWFRNKMKKYNN